MVASELILALAIIVQLRVSQDSQQRAPYTLDHLAVSVTEGIVVLRLSSVGNLWPNAPLRFAFCFCVSFPHLFIYLLLYVWFHLVIKPRVAMMISRFIIWLDDLLFSSVILSSFSIAFGYSNSIPHSGKCIQMVSTPAKAPPLSFGSPVSVDGGVGGY